MSDLTGIDSTRRYFLGRCTGLSIGAMALSNMLEPVFADEHASARNAIGGLNNFPHFAPKARIFTCRFRGLGACCFSGFAESKGFIITRSVTDC